MSKGRTRRAQRMVARIREELDDLESLLAEVELLAAAEEAARKRKHDLPNEISVALFFSDQESMRPLDLYKWIYPKGATSSQKSSIRHALRKTKRAGKVVRDQQGFYSLTDEDEVA
jgi:DNA-binding transcriptional ArsR family regulator